MSQSLLPFLGAAGIVAYWVLCRRRSITYRERAANLLTDFFQKGSVSETEKDAAERFYLNARYWLFMPLATILAFPVILMSILSKKPEPQFSKERMAIVDACMKMYLSRNPLTGALCLMAFFAMAVLAQLAGILINRVRAVPSPSMIYATTDTAYPHLKRHAH
ncbi:hypothetical protein [Pseudomonas oryziphila]|uniref:Uncharacterized protein n=1 Tax=Pseudomonas oryziphila TaxID=2894079 RepID=A0ABM7CSV9_9PSED|nr:hypothetical protein [Pseudomonas oryziphila]AZL74550.1 hypothetical protein EI693_16320 [Pseudomonas oryziphila]